MRDPKRVKGFTLVEIMVVVTLIGLLAMLSVPAFKRVKLRAVSATFTSDMRLFTEAFQRYAQENGSFPPISDPGVMPDGMSGYIDLDDWSRTTPIGGNFRWLSTPEGGGAVMVAGSTLSLEEMQLIDDWMDDGNVSTGFVNVSGAGTVVLYIVEI